MAAYATGSNGNGRNAISDFQIYFLAKKRLGDKSEKIIWVVSHITEFQPDTTFDVWHDWATFHFLTTADQIAKYMDTARNSVSGFLTIGTFSDNGPKKCSGLQTNSTAKRN